MVDKRALNSQLCAVTTISTVFGSVVQANMKRYIYKVKTVNRQVGANEIDFGHAVAAALPAYTTLDYFDHATQYEVYNDPDELTEDALPIYIIPAGNQIYAQSDNGPAYLYIEYEDAP